VKQTKTPAPTEPAPITFAQNILFRDKTENRSIFLPAGEPSPWRDLSDVPEPLRALVGEPSFELPPNTPTQCWVPPEMMEMEREAFRQLAGDEDMDPAIRAALAARDAEHQQTVEARNKTYDEIEGRRDEAYDRVAKELTDETDRLIERKS
jgi:hypothetical protein